MLQIDDSNDTGYGNVMDSWITFNTTFQTVMEMLIQKFKPTSRIRMLSQLTLMPR